MGVEQLAGRRVVVVDDDLNQAASLAQLLRLEGVAASHEHRIADALVHLMREPPDAVIVDVKMPELSGTDLVATLRVKNRSLPAVFLTGYPEDDPRVQPAMSVARVAYLSKPVELGRLLEVLTELIVPRS